jgi:hypothetical protein
MMTITIMTSAMLPMDDDVIRAKLQRYTLDGTEALQAIRLVLDSPNRPPDVMKAIGAILRRQYAGVMHVDVVLDLLDGLRTLSATTASPSTGTDTGLAPEKEYDDGRIDHVE